MIHIPNSTYRIQFNSKFKFSDTEKIIGYLKELGISDLYASPIFKARKGSMHGYDIVEPNQLNPELGGEAGFEKLNELCKSNNIGWLQDIVPNHMAYNFENQMLIDLLENGQDSRYYHFFDIEWNHPHASVRKRVLAPFLGKFYQQALEGGEIKLRYDENGFSINYYDTRLPLKIESYADVLSYRQDKLRNRLGMNNPDYIKHQGILYVLKFLPSAEELDERYYQIKFVKGIIWELYNSNNEVKDFIDETIKIYNSERELTGNYDLLDKLLSEQHFRLAYWKVANEEINYRRFFNINELISLKMEDENTFNRTHSLIVNLVGEGKFTGLRIDHVDGLYDPKSYLGRLRERVKKAYIIVEKILEMEEELPHGWQIQGTTGYEFMNYLNGIFCQTKNEQKINSIYTKFTGFNIPFEKLFHDKKRLIIESRMAGEVERLAYAIEAISSKDRYGIDITMHGLKLALQEILTYFPIYRTYISGGEFYQRDKKYIEDIIEKVRQNNTSLANEFNYIGNLLLQKYGNNFSEEQKKNALDFIMRFQQLTGPLMAKGFEDTTLYIYNRFISLNEVGGNPVKFGVKREKFFEFLKNRSEKLPHSLNTTSTHDTKRGEDVRARLNVLSEMPEEWEARVKNWNKLNRKSKTKIEGNNFPDRNDEYFLYQVMVGSYPANHHNHDMFVERLKEYVVKAAREAKVHSAWVKPNIAYENAFTSFVGKILDINNSKEFFNDFLSFQKMISFFGVFNSLSQMLIKLTSPGIPDIYQGTELWDFSMVDPDNRRPVDFAIREKYLDEIKNQNRHDIPEYLSSILMNFTDARVKLYLLNKVLQFRNQNIELFNEGDFIPLAVSGEFSNNIIVYARKKESPENVQVSVTIVPRFLTDLIKENPLNPNLTIKQGVMPLGKDVWKNTSIELPTGINNWKNIITGEEIKTESTAYAGEIFKYFPAVLLNGYK